MIVQPVSATELSVGKSCSLQGLSIKVTQIDQESQRAKIELTGRSKSRRMVSAGRLLKLKDFSTEDSEHLLRIVGIRESAIRIAVLDPLSPVASIESKRVGAQRFSGSDKLGSGIQTIEKAKQASLVAVDFDLNFNGTLLAQSKPGSTRKFRSFVILGNGVHWTPHDLAVLETYVDYTYLVEDQAILRYAEFVRKQAVAQGDDFFSYFMKYFQGMTKTPPDAFLVHDSDFSAVRPKNAGPLLFMVENQIVPYPVSTL